jgi:N-acetylglutamate synthase-like GNAT family acetyltransferase
LAEVEKAKIQDVPQIHQLVNFFAEKGVFHSATEVYLTFGAGCDQKVAFRGAGLSEPLHLKSLAELRQVMAPGCAAFGL